MQINLMLNGVRVSDDVAPDTLLIDFVRRHGCLSVKRTFIGNHIVLCTGIDNSDTHLHGTQQG